MTAPLDRSAGWPAKIEDRASIGHASTGVPSVAEVAALTRRLRTLSHGGGSEAERAEFLADKADLLARITSRYQHEQR